MNERHIIFAHLVSRVEAVVVSSLLRANGVPNFISGDAHASVEVNVWVLGGSRIVIREQDHEEASEIMAEAWLAGTDEPSYAQGRAVLRVLAVYSLLKAIVVVPCAVSFGTPLFFVGLLFSDLLGLPVNPQGRGDYYLLEGKAH